MQASILKDPWIHARIDFNGALYGIMGKNFVRYGYWLTRFSPSNAVGIASIEDLKYPFHYPPMLPILISLNFRLFGIHEWAARIIPLIFSIGNVTLIYLFAKKILDTHIALLTVFFFAIMPAVTFFGSEVEVNGAIALFFPLVMFYCYILWREKTSQVYLFGLVLAFVVGSLIHWGVCYMFIAILLHHYSLLRHKKVQNSNMSLAVFLIGLYLFLYLILSQLILGSNSNLLSHFLMRASVPFDINCWYTWIKFVCFTSGALFTLPLMILSFCWLVQFVLNSKMRMIEKPGIIVFMLFVFGLSGFLLLPQFVFKGTPMLIFMSPAIAMSAAIISYGVYQKMVFYARGRRVRLVKVFFLIILAVIFFHCYLLSCSLFVDKNLEGYRMGQVIRNNTDFTDRILMSNAYMLPQTRIHYSLKYYSDRHIETNVINRSGLYHKMQKRKFKYFFMHQKDLVLLSEFYSYLDRNYPSKKIDAFIVFDLEKPRLNQSGLSNTYINSADTQTQTTDLKISYTKQGKIRILWDTPRNAIVESYRLYNSISPGAYNPKSMLLNANGSLGVIDLTKNITTYEFDQRYSTQDLFITITAIDADGAERLLVPETVIRAKHSFAFSQICLFVLLGWLGFVA